MRPGISVIVPTIAPRGELLQRALASVIAQTHPAEAIHVAADTKREGAPKTRDRALAAVATEYVACLDDDDQLLPFHLERLADHQQTTGADLVYPWFLVSGGYDPFPQHYKQPWNDNDPHQIPVTWLARTETIREAGGFSRDWDDSQGTDPGTDKDGNRAGEDYRLILRLVKAGAKIVHLPARTWWWHHDSGNSMGLPSRVDW